MKIYLSPSDQWSNIVADGEHSEAHHCTLIAKSAKKYLEANGYTVRIGDNTKEKTYSARVKESNNWNSDLHICIHTNAGGGEGTLVMAYPSSCSNKYVEEIYKTVASLTPTKDKGIQPRTNLYEIKKTSCTCVYIEVDFHDNATIENWIDANTDNIGKAIAKGVCAADGKNMVDDSETTDKPVSGTLYKVQAGAFKEKRNADELSSKLNSRGYGNFVYYDSSSGLYKVQVGAYTLRENAKKQKKTLWGAGFDAFVYRC